MTDNTKEEFCGACLAIPLAMAGVGVTASGAHQKGDHKKRKKIMLWGGIGITVLSVIIAVYFLFIKKCKECR